MKDLKINYLTDDNKRVCMEYNTIMDFIDSIESDDIDIPMLDYTDVNAMFFEQELRKEKFDTIDDLYKHCKNILK